jgi:putative acetyltransferase
MSAFNVSVRAGTAADAASLTALHLRSIASAMPWLVSPHDEASTRRWMEHVVLAGHRVLVAEEGARLLGFAAIDGRWLEQLYIDPEAQGVGVGRCLLDAAKRECPGGLQLHVFTRNVRARAFYEAAGFRLTDYSDGSRNEEGEPDCTYAWQPPGIGCKWVRLS